ncbi:MAG: hypothetical protein ACMG6S_06385 [Byssovorax sp.]
MVLAFGSLAVLVPACAGVAPEVMEEDDAAQEELRDGPREVEPSKRIVCGGGGPEACMKQCHYAGTACFTRVEHPHRPEVGIGDLYACRVTMPKSCDYRFPSGETCTFFKHPNRVFCRP